MLEWLGNIWEILKDGFKGLSSLPKVLKENHQIQKQLEEAQSRIRYLEDQLTIKENAKLEGEFLWLYGERICLKCHDSSDSKSYSVVRLLRDDPEEEESFHCVNCKTRYLSLDARRRFQKRVQYLEQMQS